MNILGIQFGGSKTEARSTVPQSASPEEFYQALGISWMGQADAVPVTIETALGVPACWSAVNFIAGTIAGLPMHMYRRKSDGSRTKVSDTPLARILHDAPNDEQSSFEFRKWLFEQVLTGGRGLAFIERNAAREVMNIWPLEPSKVTIRREDGRKLYDYTGAQGRKSVTYTADEIIDIPFMLKADGLGHRGPIMTNKGVVGLAIAANDYASKYFLNGGVPPFAITGNFQSGKSMNSAAADMQDAVRKAAKERRQALVLPSGLEIKAIGADAEKTQLLELKQFMVEEFARIYSLPPVFLQDLTHGTFSNTEQQDLHFVKHTLKRWVEAFEQELNLKLFGRQNKRYFVEMNMDGLLRGDFKARMEGYARGVQSGILKPNEARQMENRPDDPDGDTLLVQGAMVPIAQAGQALPPVQPPAADEDERGAPTFNITLPEIKVETPQVRAGDVRVEVHLPKRGAIEKTVTAYDEKGRIVGMTEKEADE
jgi:HK97 family phage portal protein